MGPAGRGESRSLPPGTANQEKRASASRITDPKGEETSDQAQQKWKKELEITTTGNRRALRIGRTTKRRGLRIKSRRYSASTDASVSICTGSGRRHECGAAKDTVQHTVEICSAHEEERDKLRNEIGEDLSPADFIRATTDDDRKRTTVITFCEKVMTAKEAEERKQEETDPVRIARRRMRAAGRSQEKRRQQQ